MKIGIIGYGSVGKFLVAKILKDQKYKNQLSLAFVWNRTSEKLNDDLLPEKYHLTGELEIAFHNFIKNKNRVDIVIELAHPDIVQKYGAMFLEHCDFLPTSLTAFADPKTEIILATLAKKNNNNHGLYIPTGAAWGIADIQKMNELGTLKTLNVSMSFHADALKLKAALQAKLIEYLNDDKNEEALLLIEDSVRNLAFLAPNNVNTMCCLALAANSIGFDNAMGKLYAHKKHHAHIVEITINSPDGFAVKTTRYNPAKKQAVTGAQTYNSFLMSLLRAGGQGNGIHFC